jgi:hypothetical protein
MSIALEFRLHILWTEFFPDEVWPGDPAAALDYLAGELRMLRETNVRPTDEIQLAHDILTQLIVDQPILDLVVPDADQQRAIHASCDVLCWTLHHDHNQTFAENFAKVTKRLKEMDVAIIRYPMEENI